MGAIDLDDATESEINGSCEKCRCDGQWNQINQEGILLEDVVVHPNSATVTDDFTEGANDHADHETPGFVLDSEKQLTDHAYGENGQVGNIASKGRKIFNGATLNAAGFEGAVLS